MSYQPQRKQRELTYTLMNLDKIPEGNYSLSLLLQWKTVMNFGSIVNLLKMSSGKGKVKWRSAQKKRRVTYLQTVVSGVSTLRTTLFYAVFRRTTDYDSATIDGLVKTIRKLSVASSQVYVYVDGLAKSKCHVYKTILRQRSCPVKKVSSIRKDENEPLIRLADALAGAAAELIKYEDSELNELFFQAKQSGVITEL